MAQTAFADTDPDALDDIVAGIEARHRITAEDVLALRRQVFPDGVISLAEADAVFRLDHACAEKAPEWIRFYVDALTDFFVWQSEPRGYVGEGQAAHLIAEVTHDGHIDQASELELLINVVHWCESCPESLAKLAIEAVRESVLSPATAAYGSNRAPAVIAPADVALIRKVIYAPGSPGGFTVTRGEAEILVELDHATRGAENAEDWPDLFAKGVANALMFPRGAPVVPSADEALRREAWLEERPGIGALLGGVGKALASGDVPVGEAFGDRFGKRRAAQEQAREDARVAEALSREAIDQEEAKWLVARLAGGGAGLSEGAVRLLRFVRENATHIDPALEPLLQKAGV